MSAISSFLRFSAKHAILLVAVLMFGGAMWLVAYTDTNVLTRDQWGFLDIVVHYKESGPWISDIWAGHSVHRMPAYKILFLLDALWFNLNVVLESYLGVISLAASSWLIYLRYRKSLDGKARAPEIQLSFLVLCAILFSFNQWALYIYPLSALDDFLGNFGFIAAWYFLDKELYKTRSSLGFEVGFSAAFILLLLCFGEGRIPAIIAATLVGMIVHAFCGATASGRPTWRFIAIVFAACLLSIWLYFGVGTEVEGASLLGGEVVNLLKSPLQDARYLLLALEMSAVSSFTYQPFTDQANYAIGLLVGCCYLAAFWLYWNMRMTIRSRIPLFLMAYSLFFIGLVMIGRFRLPAELQIGPYPRYAADLQLGLIGIFWVFYEWLYSVSEPVWRTRVRYAAVGLLSVCVLIAEIAGAQGEIAKAGYQRAQVQRFQKFLLSDAPNKYQDDPPAAYFCPATQLCQDGNGILKKYRLAPFDSGN